MATDLTVGQSVPLSIAFLDQNGQPLSPTPTPDSPPTWASSASGPVNVTVAADGLTADVVAVAAGTDTITLTVVVGGATYTASLDVTVAAVVEVPVLTSVEIVVGSIGG